MKFTSIILLVLLAITVSASAQEMPLNATWKDSARNYIQQLKQGALIVRLHSRSQAILKLKEMGNNDQAKVIEKDQQEENKEIIQAFRSEFNFCKVYFFLADSTDALLKGKRSGFFLNDSLQTDPSISLNENFFMVAEKGNPHLHLKVDRTQPKQEKEERSYLNETIILMDDHFNTLKSPFPYYAQEPFPSSILTSDWKEKVRTLSSKLHSFYKKSV